MSSLLDRLCALTVDAWQARDLRVAFSVTRTTSSKPNTAELTIFGLSETSRGAIGQKGQAVRLVAGYRDNAEAIFAGQVMHCQHRRVAGGWETVLEVRDGHPQWTARASRAYGSATKHRLVLEQLATDMGLQLSPAAVGLVGSDETRGPLVVHGFAHEAFEILCRTLGLEWSIQDGALQLLRVDTATTETAVVLDSESGLVGTPEKVAAKSGQRARVRVTSLLQPSLRPGRRVELRSATVQGAYRVEKVTFTGDTHGQPWYAECELKEV